MSSSNHSRGISPRSLPLRESWMSNSLMRVAVSELYSVKSSIFIVNSPIRF